MISNHKPFHTGSARQRHGRVLLLDWAALASLFMTASSLHAGPYLRDGDHVDGDQLPGLLVIDLVEVLRVVVRDPCKSRTAASAGQAMGACASAGESSRSAGRQLGQRHRTALLLVRSFMVKSWTPVSTRELCSADPCPAAVGEHLMIGSR